MKPRVRGENQRHLKPPPSCMCRPSWRGEKWPTSNDGSSSVTIWIIWWICWLLVVVTLCVKDGWIRYTETWVFHQKTWLLGATLSLRDRSHPCFPCRSGFEGKLLQLGIGYAINFLTHQKKLKWWHSNRIPALNEMILPPPPKKKIRHHPYLTINQSENNFEFSSSITWVGGWKQPPGFHLSSPHTNFWWKYAMYRR